MSHVFDGKSKLYGHTVKRREDRNYKGITEHFGMEGDSDEVLRGEVLRLSGLPSGLPPQNISGTTMDYLTDIAKHTLIQLGPKKVEVEVPDFVYVRGKCIIEVIKSRGFKRFREIPKLVLQCLKTGKYSDAPAEAARSPQLATAYLSAALSPLHDA